MSNQQYRNQRPSARTTRGSGGSNAPRILMIVLIVLALAASVLMIFLKSDLWLKIAVIASLWSAFIGSVLVSLYSSQLRAERQRTRMLERTHQAELEQEISIQQQREAEMQHNFDRQLREQRDEHLDQLREELVSLRAQLAEMSGETLTPEQTSVRARAERVIELENAKREQRHTTPEQVDPEPVKTPPQNTGEDHAEERKVPGFSTGSFAAVKWTGTSSDETTQIPMIVDTSEMGSASHRQRPETPQAEPQQAKPRRQEPTPEPTPTPQQQYHGHHDAPTPKYSDEDVARRGRRRADENSEGLTVAELMQRFQGRS